MSKTLPFCCASTASVSKIVPFLAIRLQDDDEPEQVRLPGGEDDGAGPRRRRPSANQFDDPKLSAAPEAEIEAVEVPQPAHCSPFESQLRCCVRCCVQCC